MPTLRELESWLTTAQVCQITGRSHQTIITAAENKRIRAVQIGRTYRERHGVGLVYWAYDPESVDKYAKALREQEERQERGDG